MDFLMLLALLGGIGLVRLLLQWCFYQVEAEE